MANEKRRNKQKDLGKRKRILSFKEFSQLMKQQEEWHAETDFQQPKRKRRAKAAKDMSDLKKVIL